MEDSLKILALVIAGLACLTLVKFAIDQGKLYAKDMENKQVKFAFEHLLDLADTIVASLNQTVVEPLKDSDKLEFDVKKQREVLEKAKARIKDNLDNKSKELLGEYLGSSAKVDEHIEDVVEASVYRQKKK